MILNTLHVATDGYLPRFIKGIISRGYLFVKAIIEPPTEGTATGGYMATYEELEEIYASTEIVEDIIEVPEIQVEEIDLNLDLPDIDNDLTDLDFDI